MLRTKHILRNPPPFWTAVLQRFCPWPHPFSFCIPHSLPDAICVSLTPGCFFQDLTPLVCSDSNFWLPLDLPKILFWNQLKLLRTNLLFIQMEQIVCLNLSLLWRDDSIVNHSDTNMEAPWVHVTFHSSSNPGGFTGTWIVQSQKVHIQKNVMCVLMLYCCYLRYLHYIQQGSRHFTLS